MSILNTDEINKQREELKLLFKVFYLKG